MLREVREFVITYFKKDGKFYISTLYDYAVPILETGMPYMYDIQEHFQMKQNLEESMPGLSGTWLSFILIEYPESFPILILAKKVNGTV